MRISFLVSMIAALAIMTTSCSSDDQLTVQQPEVQGVDQNYISLDEALKNAENAFANMLGKERKTTRAGLSTEIFMPAKTRSSEESRYGFYVINYGNDEGFALLSADRRRSPVYALSESGSMHLSDSIENPGLSWYLNNHLPSLEAIGIHRPPTGLDSLIQQEDPYLRGVKENYIKPMITEFRSKFHQKAPYNKYCFTRNNKIAYVGCGPLAMGTIVSFYKWPTVIESYTMDWTSMYQQQYHDSWARLFEILGRPKYLFANYGAIEESKGTGVSEYDFIKAFNNLGYIGAKKTDFNIGDLQSELNSNNPVFVYGSRTGGAHVWVIDGGYYMAYRVPTLDNPSNLEKEYYYHVLWGWGGSANGFFLYKSTLGGNPVNPDPETSGSANVYGNLGIVYGYRPNK